MSKQYAISKSKLFSFIVFGLSIAYLLLSQYAPKRETVFSKHGFILLFLGFITLLILSLIKEAKIYKPASYELIFLYILTLPFIVLSTVFNVGDGASQLFGGLNNILYQLVFIGFFVLYVSYRKLSATQLSHQIAVLMMMFAVVSSVFAFQLYWTGGVLFGPLYFEDNRWPQLYGFYQSPNFFINSIGLGLFSSMFLYQTSRNRSVLRRVSFISLFLLSISAVLSGSKGGLLFIFISIVISGSLLFIYSLSLKNSIKLIRYIVLLLVFLFLLSVAVFSYLSYLEVDSNWLFRSVIRLQSISTGTGRLELWSHSIDIIINSNILQLLIGHGNEYIISNFEASTHNAHLKVIIEYGVFCYLLLWVLFVLAAFNLVNKRHKFCPSLTFFLLCLLVFSFLRPLLNAGLLSAGLLGFTFILVNFISSYRVNFNNENTLSI